MNWQDVCEDKSLANLPYKIELTREGKIIMSPTRNKHGFYQTRIAYRLINLLPDGQALTECAVDTPEGTIVADVVWASAQRYKIIEDEFSCSVAPEICVEVWSESNTPAEIDRKRNLYLDKGAIEFWYCNERGQITFYDAEGQLPATKLCPKFPKIVS